MQMHVLTFYNTSMHLFLFSLITRHFR